MARRRSAQPVTVAPQESVVAPAAPEPVVEEQQVEEQASPEQPQPPEAQEPEVQEPVAPPTPPRVVTRTRRGAASRPAGPPAALTTDGVTPEHDGVEHVPVKKKGSRKR